jgi:hypothetical protein
MALSGKDEASDLTSNKKKALKRALEAELRARQAKPMVREKKSWRTRE